MAKILCYIDNMQRGGAQRVMCNLVEHFNGSGHEVILCNDFVLDPQKPQYSLSPEVKRVYLEKKWSGNVVTQNIKRIIALRRTIKDVKPEITLSFLGRPNIRMLIAAIGLKTRTIVSVRNDPYKEYGQSKFKKKITQSLFELADGCVFQTEDAKNYFSKSVQQRSCVIMNPVDERFFRILSSKPRRHVVTLGRLMKQKNQLMLIRAYASICHLFLADDLYIYGIGDMKEQLSDQANMLGIGDRVHFPGNTDNVTEVLSQAKLFVLSSDYEGMPNALMEAMAAGVASISTDCPCGGPKMLNGGQDAIKLIPVGATDKLAEAMGLLLSNEDLRREYEQKAKERSQIFSPERIYSNWDQYLFGSR